MEKIHAGTEEIYSPLECARAIIDGNELGYVYAFPDKRLYQPVENPGKFIEDTWKDYKGEIGLYIHVPYCTPKPPTEEVLVEMEGHEISRDGRDHLCGYCNLFTTVASEVPASFTQLLIQEISMYKKLFAGKEIKVNSLYFGGGSPSLLDVSDLAKIYNNLSEIGDFSETSERAIECIPDSIDEEKLQQLKNVGINRISVGVQTFDPRVLRYTGRDYNSQLGYEVTQTAINLGFNDVNVDLIVGLPGSSKETFMQDIDTARRLGSSTITLYQNMVREVTRFGKQQQYGILPVITPDEIYRWIAQADKGLQEDGYKRVSLTCWTKTQGYQQGEDIYQGTPILGVGPGARTYGPQAHYSTEYAVSTKLINYTIKRWGENISRGEFPAIKGVKLSGEIIARMKVVLGLMSNRGIADVLRNNFSQEFDALDKLGLIICESGTIRYTNQGKAHSGALARLFFGKEIEAQLSAYQHK